MFQDVLGSLYRVGFRVGLRFPPGFLMVLFSGLSRVDLVFVWGLFRLGLGFLKGWFRVMMGFVRICFKVGLVFI